MSCRLLVTFVWTLLIFAIFESAEMVPYIRSTEDWPEMVPDKETGVRVAQWTKEMNANPEELGSYIEGDIIITRGRDHLAERKHRRITKRNGMSNEFYRWPNGIIPYEIGGDFNYFELNRISTAMEIYGNYTCIKFIPRTSEKDYIVIGSGNTGCWSNVGRISGVQQVNLQRPYCLIKIGTVLHELMHVCGFWHEHTRDDRDDYVKIIWDNIPKEAKNNFVKVAPGITDSFDVLYDYGSVMHYSAYAFAIHSDTRTIIPTKDPNAKIGQREGFSASDILKLNRMYNCYLTSS